MRPVESLAKRLLESLLPGTRLQYQDDQRTSVPDFHLFYAGVKNGVVEVTSSADRGIIECAAALRKTGAFTIPRRLCKRDWLLFPSREAKIRLFPSSVDAYLSVIEGDGLERFSPMNCDNPGVLRIWRDLRIEGGFVLQTKKPGFIYISRAGQGCSPVGTSAAINAGLAEASKKDNRDKLASSGAASRHLAVHIDISNSRAWTSLHDFDPPNGTPGLPPEITDLWLFAETPCPDQCTVWHADQFGWRNLGIVVLTRSA